MATGANLTTLASQARRLYTEEVIKGLEPLLEAIGDHARSLQSKTADHAAVQRRRDAVMDLQKFGWHGSRRWSTRCGTRCSTALPRRAAAILVRAFEPTR